MKKIISVLSLMFIVSACAAPNITKNNSIITEKDGNLVADIGNGQKGANFSIKIDFSKFTVKANISGSVAKTSANISQYMIYLVKNASTTGYPAGGDPIADKIAGPFTVTNSGASSKLITFANVGSSGGQAYYAAVRAMESSNDIIKPNNGSGTPWGSATQLTVNGSGKLAVSNGNGIIVDNNLQVNSTTPMTVTPNLLDGVGAILEANVTPNNGSSTLPAVTGF